MNSPTKTDKANPFQKLVDEFSPRIGEVFEGENEHWSERETVKPIYQIRGEILEVKASGLCIDDGKGDEIFISFFTLAAHRKALRQDMKADCGMF